MTEFGEQTSTSLDKVAWRWKKQPFWRRYLFKEKHVRLIFVEKTVAQAVNGRSPCLV
jgi:hypothetical protein